MSTKYTTDLNNDGTIDKDEVAIIKRRFSTHRKLAIFSMLLLCVSGIWIIGFTPSEKITALDGVIDLYWITLGGVIATYMGSDAWSLQNNRKG